MLTRKQWAELYVTKATLLGANIEFCGLNGFSYWCIHETGSVFSSPWRCAEEYLREEHGLTLLRSGELTRTHTRHSP